MTSEAAVLTKLLATLPPDKRRQVVDFAQSLQTTCAKKRPLRSLEGCLAHLGIHITEEDIAQARKEMWGNFPREFPEEHNLEPVRHKAGGSQ